MRNARVVVVLVGTIQHDGDNIMLVRSDILRLLFSRKASKIGLPCVSKHKPDAFANANTMRYTVPILAIIFPHSSLISLLPLG